MSYGELVVLVPGFLGFSRFGEFYYFADRVIGGLRAILEERRGAAVPVIPCATLPTSSLAERQLFLRDTLRRLVGEKLPGVERLHLVGHSTGGVDAALLACTTRLSGEPWESADEPFRRRLISVTTLAAPHHGTGLAESVQAALPQLKGLDPRTALKAGKILARLLRLLAHDLPMLAELRGTHAADVERFLREILRSRDLISDLRPAHMVQVQREAVSDPRVRITCFACGTAPRDRGRPSDGLFREMYGLTADPESQAVGPMAAATEALTRWIAQPENVIRGPSSVLPVSVDAGLNDGVVNSARQILDPSDSSQFGGFVVADHADVLGHYDRKDALVEGAVLNAGLFHSGAGFGDDEFFTLLHRIADAMSAR
jgi:pimeloyl-ACP methyl ester carboxylesterase